MKFRAFIAMILFLASCTRKTPSQLSTAEGRVRLGLNDVAIILPYQTLPGLMEKAPTVEPFVPDMFLRELSRILVDDAAIHQKEGFAFGNVGDAAFEADVTAPGAVQGNSPYRLVSLRIDGCANSLLLQETESCERNIRLVFQPLLLDQGQVTARDNNIHAIYEPNEESFQAFVQGLRELRAAAGPAAVDEPLALHPVIAREGPDGHYFQGLLGLLRRHVQVAALKRIAFFGDTNPSELGHWPMVAFNVAQGEVVRVPLDKLEFQAGEIEKPVQRIAGAPFGFLQDPLPRGSISPSLFPLVTSFPEDPEAMDAFVRAFMQEKHRASLRLDNPNHHDPSTADCASCHMSVATRFAVEAEMRSMGMEISQADAFTSSGFNLRSDVTANFSRQALQIFSYFKTEAKIAPRAIHDAAVSADYLNKN